MVNENDVRTFKVLRKFKVVTFTKFMLALKDNGISGVKSKLNERKLNAKKMEQQRKTELEKTKDKKGNIGNGVKYNTKKRPIDIVVSDDINIDELKLRLFNILTQNKDILFNYLILGESNNKKIKCINNFKLKSLFSDRAFILVTRKELCCDDFFYAFNIIYDDKFELNVKNVLNSISGLKLYANYNNKNCVSVKSGTFYNYEGSNYYSGGAERYLIDLHSIFKDKNINLDIYQDAIKPFFRKYNNINVIGMCLKNYPLSFDEKCRDLQTKHYINLTKGKSQLHIYSSFFESYPNHVSPSIGISHGIGWDNASNKNLGPVDFWNNKKSIIESAEKCTELVSVDTNTANWFQTIDYKIGNQKFKVIPNYVDIKEFSPRKDYTKVNEKIIIVYPRRLYKPRGLYLALSAAEKLIPKYKNIEFHFVGKGFQMELDDIEKTRKKFPKNVFCYSKSPFEMHEVYKKADISLIPTLYSEGTSLSCLEAMASGNVVISTRIGGLSDLIINGHNGYLIEPNEEALIERLDYVIKNYDKQAIIKKHAVEVASTFNKKIWIERWKKVIDKFDLKKESQNIDLIEFYVEDANVLSDKTILLIKKHLKDRNLIYIRSKNKIENDNITGNLIQLVDFDDEVVNVAKTIYVEKKLKKLVKRKEGINII